MCFTFKDQVLCFLVVFCGYGIGEGNLRERDHLGDPVVDGRIILSCIFRKCDVWL